MDEGNIDRESLRGRERKTRWQEWGELRDVCVCVREREERENVKPVHCIFGGSRETRFEVKPFAHTCTK